MTEDRIKKLQHDVDLLLTPGKDIQIEELAFLQQQILEEISTLKYGNFDKSPSYGERLADQVVSFMGSWRFMIIQAIALSAWIGMNAFWLMAASQWDPYPFILLNLVLSFQAAFTAPLILMAQNRSTTEDRRRANEAYHSIDHIEQMFKILLQQTILLNKDENEDSENDSGSESTQDESENQG